MAEHIVKAGEYELKVTGRREHGKDSWYVQWKTTTGPWKDYEGPFAARRVAQGHMEAVADSMSKGKHDDAERTVADGRDDSVGNGGVSKRISRRGKGTSSSEHADD